jgi:hypothetical protein
MNVNCLGVFRFPLWRGIKGEDKSNLLRCREQPVSTLRDLTRDRGIPITLPFHNCVGCCRLIRPFLLLLLHNN